MGWERAELTQAQPGLPARGAAVRWVSLGGTAPASRPHEADEPRWVSYCRSCLDQDYKECL